MKFSITDFFGNVTKFAGNFNSADFVTFSEKNLNGEFHYSCAVNP